MRRVQQLVQRGRQPRALWHHGVCVIFLSFLPPSSTDAHPSFGGTRLADALNSILPWSHTSNNSSVSDYTQVSNMSLSSFGPSRVRRRCKDYLACEYHVPILEIDNAVFFDGKVYLHDLDAESKSALLDLKSLYGAREGYLPSTLVQYDSRSEWMHGPKYIVHSTSTSTSTSSHGGGLGSGNTGGNDKPLPQMCGSYWDTSAFFLHPWEAANAFHSLNDNVMAVLASVILQRITSGSPSGSSSSSPPQHKTLFLFKRLVDTNHKETSLIFKLLHWIFDGDVRPARSLLQGGPHCVRHISWGTSIKPFYRDSLGHLRRVIYLVLHHILRKAPEFPTKPAAELEHSVKCLQSWSSSMTSGIVSDRQPQQTSHDNNHPIRAVSKITNTLPPPRVVIVTRNLTAPDDSPYRKLSRASEEGLVKAFQQRGASAVICCDFKYVNTVPKLLSYFGHMDICIGIHGAGMSNCIFGKEGLVVLEMQVWHAHGFDSFMKIAHMAGGHYLYYDSRSVPVVRTKGAGTKLEQQVIEGMVDATLALYSGKIPIMLKNSSFKAVAVKTATSTAIVTATKSGSKSNNNNLRSFGSIVNATSKSERRLLSAKVRLKGKSSKREAKLKLNTESSTSTATSTNPNNLFSLPPYLRYYPAPKESINNHLLLLKGNNHKISALLTKTTNKAATMSDGGAVQILGPLLKNNEAHCKALPYYEFRLSTMLVKDHKHQCDRNVILRKATGSLNDKLLTHFINYPGDLDNGLFDRSWSRS